MQWWNFAPCRDNCIRQQVPQVHGPGVRWAEAKGVRWASLREIAGSWRAVGRGKDPSLTAPRAALCKLAGKKKAKISDAPVTVAPIIQARTNAAKACCTALRMISRPQQMRATSSEKHERSQSDKL